VRFAQKEELWDGCPKEKKDTEKMRSRPQNDLKKKSKQEKPAELLTPMQHCLGDSGGKGGPTKTLGTRERAENPERAQTKGGEHLLIRAERGDVS